MGSPLQSADLSILLDPQTVYALNAYLGTKRLPLLMVNREYHD